MSHSYTKMHMQYRCKYIYIYIYIYMYVYIYMCIYIYVYIYICIYMCKYSVYIPYLDIQSGLILLVKVSEPNYIYSKKNTYQYKAYIYITYTHINKKVNVYIRIQ